VQLGSISRFIQLAFVGILAVAPQFRATARIVMLDVSVHDDNRHPVRGLSVDDFEVLENGQPRPLTSLQFVDVAEFDRAAASWQNRVPQDVQDNALARQRLFVLLFDDTTWSGLAGKGRGFGHALIDRLGPGDLAAVLFVGMGGQPQEFTMDRARLHRAVDTFKIMPQPFGGLESLRKLSNALGTVPDRRKVVLYIGGGAEFDSDIMAQATDSSNPNAAESSKRLFRDLQAFIRAAERANVSVYAVDLNGLRAPTVDMLDPGRPSREFMQTISDQTGGRAVINSNDPSEAIPQILEENGSYYVLGFVPKDPEERDRFRRISVRVKRPNVTARTRRGFVMPGTTESSVSAVAELDGTGIPPWLPDSTVPMQIVSAVVRTGTSVSAIITVGVTLATTERVVVRLEAFDFENRPAGVREHTLQLSALADDAAGRLRFQTQSVLELHPGQYRLRATLQRANGLPGATVLGDLMVPDYSKAALPVSDIVLHHARAPYSASKSVLLGLAPPVPAVPTVERTFAPGDEVTAWLRLHPQSGRDCAALSRIRDAQNHIVFSTMQTMVANRGMDIGADWSMRLPLSTLTPGEYLLTVDISPDAKTTIQRMVRFTVEGPR
jgi:VWFA-related protein